MVTLYKAAMKRLPTDEAPPTIPRIRLPLIPGAAEGAIERYYRRKKSSVTSRGTSFEKIEGLEMIHSADVANIELADWWRYQKTAISFTFKRVRNFKPIRFLITTGQAFSRRTVFKAEIRSDVGFVLQVDDNGDSGGPSNSTGSIDRMVVSLFDSPEDRDATDRTFGRIQHPCGLVLYKVRMTESSLMRVDRLAGSPLLPLEISRHRKRRYILAKIFFITFDTYLYQVWSEQTLLAEIKPNINLFINSYSVLFKPKCRDTQVRCVILGTTLMMTMRYGYPKLCKIIQELQKQREYTRRSSVSTAPSISSTTSGGSVATVDTPTQTINMEEEFKSDEVFAAIRDQIDREGEELARKVACSYRFLITGGPGGQNKFWVLDMKTKPPFLGNRKGRVDCMITLSDDTFMSVYNQQLTPAQALIRGKLRMKGSIGKIMKLKHIFGF